MEEFRNVLFYRNLSYAEPRRTGWDGAADLLVCALKLFDRSRRAAQVEKAKCLFLRRGYDLLDLEMLPANQVCSRRYGGLGSVSIDIIRGTISRQQDFDARFHPISERMRDRWVSVAVARLQCIPLPPVSLIQAGGCFFVQDGHHRISVARALGETVIDAEIIVWDVAGPLPWNTSQNGQRQAVARSSSPAAASLYTSAQPEA